ncbi:MAG: tRNA-specific 2-thiouridylase MnmA [Syntrophus sp. PtaB.Bin075]|nr:MAG: tRNA-specific 2-thiouridylase MnmA [Syntrophus sp. PtaB.Bin075]
MAPGSEKTGKVETILKKRVLLAISGGVDSSVAALLLKEEGYEVAGVTMCLGVREEENKVRCCGREAIEDARGVCEILGIPHYVLDYAPLLEACVIDKFVREYRLGRTPNPCIDCNRYLKFGHLLDSARTMGFDYLATGHYAKIERKESRWILKKAKDLVKDQTYFLYPIPVAALEHILFPLADRTKDEVREIARQALLPIAEKPESQDLCFVTQDSYRNFLQEQGCPVHPGPIVDRSGRVLGEHSGTVFYTIGQRHGLGISSPFPLYVVAIDVAGNSVIVSGKEDVYAQGLVAGEMNWLTPERPQEAEARIRHRKRTCSCRIVPEGDRIRVYFAEDQDAVTPGQAVVLYQEDEVLGGGVIEEALHYAN